MGPLCNVGVVVGVGAGAGADVGVGDNLWVVLLEFTLNLAARRPTFLLSRDLRTTAVKHRKNARNPGFAYLSIEINC